MPLSEHEEKILAEIERQLAAEDPRFASRARRSPPWAGMTRQKRVRSAIALAILGLVAILLLGFLPGPWNLVSASFGMLLLLGAILLGVTALSQPQSAAQQHVPPDERL